MMGMVDRNPGSSSALLENAAEFNPDESYASAINQVSLREAEEFAFELIIGTPGKYRISAIMDYRPFPLFNGESVIDCVIGRGESIMFTAPVEELFSPGEYAFFLAVMDLDEPMVTNERMRTTPRMEILR